MSLREKAAFWAGWDACAGSETEEGPWRGVDDAWKEYVAPIGQDDEVTRLRYELFALARDFERLSGKPLPRRWADLLQDEQMAQLARDRGEVIGIDVAHGREDER